MSFPWGSEPKRAYYTVLLSAHEARVISISLETLFSYVTFLEVEILGQKLGIC